MYKREVSYWFSKENIEKKLKETFRLWDYRQIKYFIQIEIFF